MRFIINSDLAKFNCISWLKSLHGYSEVYEVNIRPYKKNRSVSQNRLYWLWVNEIKDHIERTQGKVFSTDDIHEWFKDELLPQHVIEINGKAKKAIKSTSALTTKEFTEYLEKIDWYCSDNLGLNLPHPLDLYYESVGYAKENYSKAP